MIIDCISDLHGHYPKLEGGDLLIVAGDLTGRDTEEAMFHFYSWLDDQDYTKKIFTGGNHDNQLQQCGSDFFLDREEEAEYLCDSETEFEGLKIFGSPWSKRFKGMNPKCMAFTVDTEEELDKIYYRIPNEIDILITHEAPYGILDRVDFSEGESSAYSVGSHALVYHSRMRQPKLHIFGHIHEGYGEDKETDPGIHYVNASHVNERYQPVNKPIRVIL